MINRVETRAHLSRCASKGTSLSQFLPEDLVWSGLSLEVFSEEELARHQAAAEMRTCFHRGVWWRRVTPFFCRTSFPLSQVDHRKSWPYPLHSIGGYMHFSAPHSPSNGSYPLIVHEDIAGYSIQRLGAGERSKIRRGLARLDVRIVERFQDLRSDGREVYESWRQRVGWYEQREFDSWISWAFEHPKRLVLGAYKENKLVAFVLPYALGNAVVMAFAASHSRFFKCYPNDVLFHALLCIARQTPGVETVAFSAVAKNPSQNEFKLGYGFVKHVRTYTWLNPLVRPIWQQLVRRRPWMTTLISNQTAESC